MTKTRTIIPTEKEKTRTRKRPRFSFAGEGKGGAEDALFSAKALYL